MSIFGGVFSSLMNMVSSVFGNGIVDSLDDMAIAEMFETHSEQLSTMVTELTPYATKADESYLSLIYNKLEQFQQ